jgi:hypothetical protein
VCRTKRQHVLGEQLVDLLFCCVEGKVAHVEGCRVLQLVLRVRAGASLVIVAVPSALLLNGLGPVHTFEGACGRMRAHVGACRRTFAVAYELGLSRRSIVLLMAIVIKVLVDVWRRYARLGYAIDRTGRARRWCGESVVLVDVESFER